MTGGLRISGRNKITGTVKEIELDGLLARVVLSIGRQTITAIITREACLELDLEVGDRAAALVKATEVMILKSEPKG
jgi:molybdopterin-binding protein